jgi:23S rRNA (adenine2503-C2)-methyltransferase
MLRSLRGALRRRASRGMCTALNLVGMPLGELVQAAGQADAVGELLSPAMAALLFKRVHRGELQRLEDFDAVAEGRRARLAARFRIALPTLVEGSLSRSNDGTAKWMMEALADDRGRTGRVDTVLIPEMSKQGGIRGVLCVSSQVGCSLACTFCKTGTQRLLRNLAAADIVGQAIVARRMIADAAAAHPLHGAPQVSNVVFMGQGEPLLNWRAVAVACRVLTHPAGLGLSPRRVTVSTSGIAPLMPRVATELGVSLALSLHAPTDALRSRIMPINATHPLACVLQACREYATAGREGRSPRRMLWEYTLLAGVNDTPACRDALIDLLRRHALPVALNLIPFNPWQGAAFATPHDDTVTAFARALLDAGFLATVRWPRGRDIGAACGQLHSAAVEPALATATPTVPPLTACGAAPSP